MQKHDAKTGFFDIKPPGLSVESNNSLNYILYALLAALILFVTFKLIKGLLNKRLKTKKENAFKTFEKTIKELHDDFNLGKYSLKEFSDESSKSLRKLIYSITNYPAVDRTEQEIKDSLKPFLIKKFSNGNINRINKAEDSFLSALNKASYYIYSSSENQSTEKSQLIADEIKVQALDFSKELNLLESHDLKRKETHSNTEQKNSPLSSALPKRESLEKT